MPLRPTGRQPDHATDRTFAHNRYDSHAGPADPALPKNQTRTRHRFPIAAMNITINQQATELREDATVADALALLAPRPPFAVAVNTVFVPKARYAEQALNDGDRLEVISPVTGG